MRTATLDPSATTSVGRVGELILEYARQDKRTILLRSRSSSPWHLFPPIDLDDSGAAYTLLVNPSGGLVGGDHVSIQASLGSNTHVVVSTPSANRVYRTLSEPAVQAIELSVGAGAILEWIPEVTIPFAGSRFKQTIHVRLARGATTVLWDSMASGRMGRGERWAFDSFENEISVTTASGRSMLERYVLQPTQKRAGVGLVEQWNYVASFYVIGEAIAGEREKKLEEQLAGILDDRQGEVLGGVSEPAVPGLAVKVVARSAPDLNSVLEAMWEATRRLIWELPALALRRY